MPTGGTITTSGGYRIHTYTGVGSASFDVPSGFAYNNVEVLVVAGGGGGGMDMGGGGGAGGVVHATHAVSAGSYTVTVGAGGNGGPAAGTNGQPGGHQYQISATNGGNSVFGSKTAIGGGYGGSSYYGYTPNYGQAGAGGCGAQRPLAGGVQSSSVRPASRRRPRPGVAVAAGGIRAGWQ